VRAEQSAQDVDDEYSGKTVKQLQTQNYLLRVETLQTQNYLLRVMVAGSGFRVSAPPTELGYS
jgi:hypothetical protein